MMMSSILAMAIICSTFRDDTRRGKGVTRLYNIRLSMWERIMQSFSYCSACIFFEVQQKGMVINMRKNHYAIATTSETHLECIMNLKNFIRVLGFIYRIYLRVYRGG